MNRFLRALAIWIVALALPLQGYAAAAMITCGPMHSQIATASEHSPSHHDAMAAGHSHPAVDEDEPSVLAKFLAFKCSACASCCTASAAPAPVMPFPGLMQAHTAVIPFSGSSEDTVVPDGIERPPRTSLV
jgi:hypothetical protein